MNNIKGAYGEFDMARPGTYVINTLNLPSSWEYIYQNKDVMLRVDQYGPVSAQAYPPQDIMLFQRARDDRYSKWLIWFKCDEINGGKPFSNFMRPCPSYSPDFEPEDVRITFAPHQAEYCFKLEGIEITTILMVPTSGCDIVSRVSVKNTTGKALRMRAYAALLPYVNKARLEPWDKPEWYLKSGFGVEKDANVFFTQLLDSGGDEKNRRAVTLWSTAENAVSFEVVGEEYVGAGDFVNPESIYKDALKRDFTQCSGYGEFVEGNTIYGYPPVYALGYDFNIGRGGEKVIRQVLSLQPLGDDFGLPSLSVARKPARFLEDMEIEREKKALTRFFNKLFGVRSIRTSDTFFDYYVGSWLPLQMYWIGVLDRGWPTGMRGTRDACNDFMGLLHLDTSWARRIILELSECQRTDGWFPRQVSTEGKYGTHDMREYVDGGAFYLELLYEYLCYTGDMLLLDESISWLDGNNSSCVFSHMLRALDYYIDERNIGEHQLCKIRGGDWLDPVNRAGLSARGESITVTCQVIMAIEYVSRIIEFTGRGSERLPTLEEARERLKDGLLTHAYNEKGFFNSVYNDDGKWLFSDCDPDGACRPYIPANAFAIISGVAQGECAERIIEHMESLKFDAGYHLFWPPLGNIKIDKLGRSGTGDVPPGLSENATPYNHGSHGFLGRAYAVAGESEKLFEVFKFMMPYDLEKHSTEQAKTPPYAVLNSWHQVPTLPNRGGMLFLTGSVAMALRMVYNWMLGIEFGLDYFRINPVISEKLGSITFETEIRGRPRKLEYKKGRVFLDGNRVAAGEKLEY